jgi:hypothetical protein
VDLLSNSLNRLQQQVQDLEALRKQVTSGLEGPGTMTFICLVKMYEKLVGGTLRLTWFFHVDIHQFVQLVVVSANTTMATLNLMMFHSNASI